MTSASNQTARSPAVILKVEIVSLIGTVPGAITYDGLFDKNLTEICPTFSDTNHIPRPLGCRGRFQYYVDIKWKTPHACGSTTFPHARRTGMLNFRRQFLRQCKRHADV
jgi:hypothetical protein